MENNKFLDILENCEVESTYVDCGQGDLLRVIGVSYNPNGKSLRLKIDKRDLVWIKMDVKHPIKLTSSD
jgi:hypothetical protein